MKELRIGRQSAGYISRGHPWLRPDRFTHGLELLAPGEAVTLVDERGRKLASALADPGSPVAARVYHRQPERGFDPAAALARAWQRRQGLHNDPATDCYRIVNGESDFLPGLVVERYAGVLVAQCRTRAMQAHRAAVLAGLAALAPQAHLIWREHLDDLRREEVRSLDRAGAPADAELLVLGRELGVTVELRPAAGLATGIYVDQRATRAWLRRDCAGLRVLNLFAYTGLFSVSLLTAGAGEALDLDLSGPALATATANARRNGVADRHRTVQGDCRQTLAQAGGGWDLVILDPPTAAAGGGGGWVARRDYAALAQQCWAALAPGGRLVACSNTAAGRDAMDPGAILHGLAGAEPIPAPEPADDIPLLSEFPEGRPWRMAVARRQ